MNHSESKPRIGTRVLGTFIDAGSWSEVINALLAWAAARKHGAVCLCNVHSAVTALDDQALANALGSSEMVLPDGAPIAWTMRRKGFQHQSRIAGPDLMERLCEAAAERGVSVFLFGSKPETLRQMEAQLRNRLPKLDIRGSLSPRFGEWTQEEENDFAETINASGADLVFVGLGCPKQEIWMSRNKPHIHGILLGVGAAFDFHAGTLSRAPQVYQRLGMEWLHRLFSEPRRLWRRYFFTNSRFLVSLPATLRDKG